MKYLLLILFLTINTFGAEPNRISKNSDFSLGRTGWTYTGSTTVVANTAMGSKQSLAWGANSTQTITSPKALFQIIDKTCQASIDYYQNNSNSANFYLTIVNSSTGSELISSTDRVNGVNIPAGTTLTTKTVRLLFPCLSIPAAGVSLKLVATGAVDVILGNANISVAEFGTVPNITDWQPLTVTAGASATIRSTGTAPSFGTVDTNIAYYRRVGGNLEIKWDYRQTAGGSAGTGAYLFNISQLNLQIDTTKVKATTGVGSQLDFGSGKVGDFEGFANDSGARFSGGVYVYDAQNLKIGYLLAINGTGAAGFNIWGSGGAQLSTTNITYNIRISVPIVGWSTSETVTNARCPNDKDCENNFTAKGSSTGVVTDDTLDFINGNCTNANPSVCTFNSGFFTVAPNCPGSSAVTSTTVSYPNTSGFTVSCFKAPTDYKPKQNIQGQISNTVYSDTGLKIEKLRIAGATSNVVCSSSPCGVYLSTSGVSSVTRSGTGTYTINFISGRFTENIICTGIAWNGVDVVSVLTGSSPSTTTTYTLGTHLASIGPKDTAIDIICVGK